MDTQQLILNRNPFAAPTEEAIGADFIGRESVLKEDYTVCRCGVLCTSFFKLDNK